MAALDTNVLVRFLMQDDAAQTTAARRLIRQALGADEPLFVPVSVALEFEWVLRSRFELDKSAVLQKFSQLLSTVELSFEADTALEWALRQHRTSSADFSDCLHAALATRAGERPLWTFDKAATKVDGVRLLAA